MKDSIQVNLDEDTAAGNWVPFDGFEYRAVSNGDSTYRIINEDGDTIAKGILLISDSPYHDLVQAVIHSQGDV